MSVVALPPCPHDLGPGTAVCLRCRLDARQQARVRQRQLLTRAGVVLGGVAVVAVIANAALGAVQASRRTSSRQPLHLLASTSTSTVRQQGELAPAPNPTSVIAEPAPSAPEAAASPAVAPSAPERAVEARPAHGLTLRVPAGRTGLRDSMYVEREGDSAVVHFDTEASRTRRRDKFEASVRSTLPVLYGLRADSMLTALPEGALVGDRDLFGDVAANGVQLSVPGGGTLEVWPVTRPGRDGPLVVGYRARVRP